MAIAVDAVGAGDARASDTTLSWLHTVSGADRLMIVGVGREGGVTKNVTGVTLGAQNFTKLVELDNGVGSSAVFYLVAPNTGSGTVTVTIDNAVECAGNSISFTGVDQSTPIGTHATATGTGSPSVIVSSAVNDLVADFFGIGTGAGSFTPGAGQTSRYIEQVGTASGNHTAGSSTEAGAASVTMDWTTNSDSYSTTGVPIKPATAISAAHRPLMLTGVG